MPDEDPEKKFLDRAGAVIPGIAGYRDRGVRVRTDDQLRSHLASGLDGLMERLRAIRDVADEEGDLDMVEDLDRISERLGRTGETLRAADYSGCRFFEQADVEEELFSRVYSYDSAMLEDLELLSRDIHELKYESIGTLTLREVEGTLASIELRIVNRKDLFEMPTE